MATVHADNILALVEEAEAPQTMAVGDGCVGTIRERRRRFGQFDR